MTNMAVTEEAADVSEFDLRNAELFTRRGALKARLSELHDRVAAGADDPDITRELRRIRRELDAVTTEIVQLNIGLVRGYCKRFASTSSREDSADFEAAGLVGLMRGIDSFDPAQGKFGAWAYKPIQREVLRAVRAADHPNLNLGDFERRPAILRAYHQLNDASEGSPELGEVAQLAETTVEQVRRVVDAPRLDSIHQIVADDGETELGDLLPSPEPSVEATVVSDLTVTALEEWGLAALDTRELYVIVRRFGLDGEPEEKLADIGATLGLSREAVRQVEAKALAKLQHPLVLRRLLRHG